MEEADFSSWYETEHPRVLGVLCAFSGELDRTGFHAGQPIVQTLVLCRITVPLRQVVTTAKQVAVAGDTLTLLDDKNDAIATYERVRIPIP
jgi:hypothetical protein